MFLKYFEGYLIHYKDNNIILPITILRHLLKVIIYKLTIFSPIHKKKNGCSFNIMFDISKLKWNSN